MTPCNSCVNGNCGSCVADRLEREGHIRSAKFHCGCAEKGHKNTLESKLPKRKSMLGRKKVEEPPVPEIEVVDEE